MRGMEELQEKLKEYSNFLNSTLYPELQRTVAARDEIESEIREYQELHDKLSIVTNQNDVALQAMVNLGHGLIYCQAEVEDPSTVFIDVGKGFFVELPVEDAPAIIAKRLSFLQQQVLPKRLQDASRVASHVESSLAIVQALARHVDERRREQDE